MAKDNPGKRPDPGAAKTQTNSKPGNERPKQQKQWNKSHWISYAVEVGVQDAEKMTLEQVRSVLKNMQKEGSLENQRGGAREGAGRKKTVPELILDAYEIIADHAMAVVDVKILDEANPGQTKIIKMTRVEALTSKLYSMGTKGNVAAINAYLDRFAGKAKQSIEHTGDIKVEEQTMPNHAEAAAARAYEEALESGRPVKSPIKV